MHNLCTQLQLSVVTKVSSDELFEVHSPNVLPLADQHIKRQDGGMIDEADIQDLLN